MENEIQEPQLELPNGDLEILKYEIVVKYSNDNKIEGVFNTKESAIEFLESYAAPKPKEK